MSDYIIAAILSLGGVCFLILAVVVLAVRGRNDRAVSWRGLGVTFEIKPCARCGAKRS